MHSIPISIRLLTVFILSSVLVPLHGVEPQPPLSAPAAVYQIKEHLYIAPTGNDAQPGTRSQPFATLERARDQVRSLRQSGRLDDGAVTVWIRGGTYYRTNTFLLTAEDSGTESSPVIYRGYPGEDAVLSGAQAISNFVPVTDPEILNRLQPVARNNVLVADISNLGISDYGSLTNRGAIQSPVRSGLMRPWMVELFHANDRMQLARWPNQDKSGEVWAYTVAPVPGRWKESPTDNWFSYREDNPGTWALTETVWVHGGWCYWWAASYEKVLSIDPAEKRITTDRPGDFGYTANRPYEALNVLEELDLPGEWVIDRSRHRLYFWPPTDQVNTQTEISILEGDFVSLTDCDHITLRNLTFQAGRGSGVTMRRSSHNLVAGCTLRNLGNAGVVIGNALVATLNADFPPGIDHDFEGGLNNQVVGCELYALGEGGIVLSGGNRRNLTPSGNTALNNYIHHYNTNIRNYRPAVRLDGVGGRVAHNVIHDSPHQGLSFTGNDHLIEYNKIYDVCLDTDDAGLIYSVGRDWKQRGSVLRHNMLMPANHIGFYLDDFASGVTMYGNIIRCVNMAFMAGGGRDNVYENNIVVGFNSPGWHVNNRGNSWAKSAIPGLINLFKEIDTSVPPYSTRYPELSVLAEDIARYEADPSPENFYDLALPKGNQILRNIFLKANAYVYDMDTNAIVQLDNFYYWPYETGFEDPDAVRSGNFRLKADAEALAHGFQQIPFERIGVYPDPYGLVHPSRIPPYPRVLARAPFHGTPLPIPGTIQVEDFDEGPNGDAYHSTALWNNAWGSGRYRPHVPFYIWGSLKDGRRTYEMDLRDRDWTEYTVRVAQTGMYTVRIPRALPNLIRITFSAHTEVFDMVNTTELRDVFLASGVQVMRVEMNVITVGSVRLDHFEFALQE